MLLSEEQRQKYIEFYNLFGKKEADKAIRGGDSIVHSSCGMDELLKQLSISAHKRSAND